MSANRFVLSKSSGGASAISISDDGSVVLNVATDLNFTGAINVTDDGDGTVTIDVPNQSDTTTGSNIGTGDGVFSGKVGDDLQFKSLVITGPNLQLTSTATELQMSTLGLPVYIQDTNPNPNHEAIWVETGLGTVDEPAHDIWVFWDDGT